MAESGGFGERFRRYAGYAGLVVAAAASLATSEPTWTVEDAVRGKKDTLSAAAPEASHHFSVESSDAHTVRVVGWVRWDFAPNADVTIRIAKDDGSTPQETVIHSADAETLGSGQKADSYVSLGQHQVCSSAPCKQGYTVTLTMNGGAAQETVALDWAFEGFMNGDGKNAPDGAYLTITED